LGIYLETIGKLRRKEGLDFIGNLFGNNWKKKSVEGVKWLKECSC
jgi:hypothetical protein